MPQRVEILMAAAGVAAMAACAGVWHWAFNRWRSGRPVIPLARRRPVPWQGGDVLFILLAALVLPLLAASAATRFAGANAAHEDGETKPLERPDDKKRETVNPAIDLLGSGDWRMIALATVAAVVVAPLVEEFLFRVLLQGWLEAVWSRRRRSRPELRSPPKSYMPLVLPAALFALMHFRVGRAVPTPQDLPVLFAVVVARLAAELAMLGLAFCLLRFGHGATAADLGWQPRKVPADAKLALVALLAITPPVLLLQVVLTQAVKYTGLDFAPDPLPIFLLALVLGYLYQRTHRIAPSLLLHAAFNATGVAIFFVH